MKVREEVRKCVAFLGIRMADGTFRFVGSAFFLGGKIVPTRTFVVTARHVIDGVRSTGAEDIWMRLNLPNEKAEWLKIPLAEWYTHPTDKSVDVAIVEARISIVFDHSVYPYSLCITPQHFIDHEVGLGDEVFVTGLFRHHSGNKRNIPIVRIGNLACMGEEKIQTRDFGEMDAYLIEARSIGGLSGSPVFLNLGSVRVIKGELKTASAKDGPIVMLLGLVHGHYDANTRSADNADADDGVVAGEGHVNTGIAMVVPFHNIATVIAEYERRQDEGPSLP